MDQLEYVIEELERALRVWLYERTDRNLMLVQPDVVEDAIAILKALAASRQARVIKPEELAVLPEGSMVWRETHGFYAEDDYPAVPMCYETVEEMKFRGVPEAVTQYVGGCDLLREYGKSYRLWTARPTEEQRRGEKWEEQTI